MSISPLPWVSRRSFIFDADGIIIASITDRSYLTGDIHRSSEDAKLMASAPTLRAMLQEAAIALAIEQDRLRAVRDRINALPYCPDCGQGHAMHTSHCQLNKALNP